MVSLQLYLKTFFAVMPKRFKVLSELKSQKAKIDRKAISRKFLEDKEIDQLIAIIGKDSILRRAEKRNQDTLRHLIYKLLKSTENFERFYDEEFLPDPERSELETMLPRDVYLQIIKKQTKPLKDFIREMTPRLIQLLNEMDEVYRNEVKILQQCYGNTDNLVKYQEYLQIEKELGKKSKTFFSELESHSKNFVNVIKSYFKFIRKEGLVFEILTLQIGLVITWATLWGIALFSDVPKSTDIEYISGVIIKTILGGAFIAILISLAVHIKIKGKRFVKFLNDTMI